MTNFQTAMLSVYAVHAQSLCLFIGVVAGCFSPVGLQHWNFDENDDDDDDDTQDWESSHLSDATRSVPQKVEPVIPLSWPSSIHDVTQQVVHRHIKHCRRSKFFRQWHILYKHKFILQ